MAQNGGFLFWRMAIETPNLIHFKISRYTVFRMTCTHVITTLKWENLLLFLKLCVLYFIAELHVHVIY